jgi:Carboxypeptidase regulatory-like domain
MNQKSSPLTGPLWVIAIGILILGIGASFTAYMLWDQKKPGAAGQQHASVDMEELREPHRTNPAAYSERASASRSNILMKPGSVVMDQARAGNLVETASAPVQTEATVILPPPRATTLPSVSAGVSSGRPGGTIFGRVTLRGTPPPERELPLDAMCGRLYEGLPRPNTSFYVVGEENGLGDVAVHLKTVVAGGEYPMPSQSHVIDQVRCVYVPYISAARAGQTIEIRNSDPLLHNIHPTPVVPGNPESNKAQLPNGAPLNFVFPQPEMFLRFKCDVHPWMFAYVSLFPHPHFAVTASDGRFQFVAPPPGRYVLEASHRRAGTQTREIEVRAGEPLTVDFELTVPK